MKNLQIILIFLSIFLVISALEFEEHSIRSLRLQKKAKDVKDTKTVQERDNVILAKDCADLYIAGIRDSGIYTVHLRPAWLSDINVKVYCDMETDGGGWTVFQRRGEFGNPHVSFYRNWQDYSQGFGNLLEEFWLGNENIHRLSTQDHVILRIDLKDFEGGSRYAVHDLFEVGSYNDDYILTVGKYSGDAGDAMFFHHKQTFKTYDKDAPNNCTGKYKGGWWYNDCFYCNLNGLYLQGGVSNLQGIEYSPWKRSVLKWTEMKMRPKNFK